MRISMLLAAAVVGSSMIAGSAGAMALVDPAANTYQLAAAETGACPTGTYWQPKQYFTRHNGFRPAGCFR